MEIKITNSCPFPMRDLQFKKESIWKNEAIFNSPEKCLVKAPSGTGKTSLIHFIYGIRYDYEGNITVDKKECKTISLTNWAKIRQRQISIILQDMRLLPNLTLGENLLVKNRLTNHKSEAEMKAMIGHLGMAEKWNQKAGTLSIGQQQRVCIVRSLLQPFEFILMDEPFSHIDERNIELASELIINECKQNNAGWILFSLGDHYKLQYDKIYQL